MAEQSKLLMTMLGTAVAGLDRLDTIVPAIQALLWTFEQGLGEAFTPDGINSVPARAVNGQTYTFSTQSHSSQAALGKRP
jgi:hypothetical protein